MYTYVVKKEKQRYMRQTADAVILQSICYITDFGFRVDITSSFSTIMPDAFEIEFEQPVEEVDMRIIHDSIILPIQTIFIKKHYLDDICPICGKDVFVNERDLHRMCFNIDCVSDVTDVTSKLFILLKHVSAIDLSNIVSHIASENSDKRLCISEVIQYVFDNFEDDEHPFNDTIVEMRDAIDKITLTQFINTVAGIRGDLFGKLVTLFNDNLLSLIDHHTDHHSRRINEYPSDVYGIIDTLIDANDDFIDTYISIFPPRD